MEKYRPQRSHWEDRVNYCSMMINGSTTQKTGTGTSPLSNPFITKPSNSTMLNPKSPPTAGRRRRVYSLVHLDPKKSGRRFRANDRERRRMESLNGALETLKRCIPISKSKKRMTKLEILQLACNYIKNLSNLLEAATVEGMEGTGDCEKEKTTSVVNGLSISQRLEIISFGHFGQLQELTKSKETKTTKA